jgi:choline kinase
VKAIILSAGQGKRLLPLTERAPKCMLPVAGQPLVTRQIDTLVACGVEDITVVVGFGAELVETGLAQRYGARRVRTLYNPFYTITDNLVSCWVARGEMERDFLILNGDTLFASVVLERLLAAPQHPITLAVSRKDGYDDDDMKVIRDGDRLLRVGKKLPREAVNAESIGMMTFRSRRPALVPRCDGRGAAQSCGAVAVVPVADRRARANRGGLHAGDPRRRMDRGR